MMRRRRRARSPAVDVRQPGEQRCSAIFRGGDGARIQSGRNPADRVRRSSSAASRPRPPSDVPTRVWASTAPSAVESARPRSSSGSPWATAGSTWFLGELDEAPPTSRAPYPRDEPPLVRLVGGGSGGGADLVPARTIDARGVDGLLASAGAAAVLLALYGAVRPGASGLFATGLVGLEPVDPTVLRLTNVPLGALVPGLEVVAGCRHVATPPSSHGRQTMTPWLPAGTAILGTGTANRADQRRIWGPWDSNPPPTDQRARSRARYGGCCCSSLLTTPES
jgi:hypothetical protein